MKTCVKCGSTELFYDAHVGVNDPEDVRTYDAIDCMYCGEHDVSTNDVSTNDKEDEDEDQSS